ncbi:MAG TPA: amino acid ABC transporter substrate-binding protein, partial [Burkholderiaceae bacterium]
MTQRRTVLQTVAASALALPSLMRAQGAPVRVGYAIARTGPWAPGAQVSQEPNFLLWAEQQNAAGGLNVKGSKRPIELISSDDQSNIETCVRTYEKLMGSDKVDLVLPPWGSNANFAVAPLANRFGYPFLAPTALSRQLVEMRLPYFFLMLQQPKAMMDALVDMLKSNGVKTAVVSYVDDLFGLENYAALKVAVQGSGISILEDKSHPLGVKDLSPVLRSMKDKNPDAFIGLTYPPDTILASRQSKEIGFNPKFFYASVGTAFQLYRNVMAAGAEGVLGMGSWNSKTSPG